MDNSNGSSDKKVPHSNPLSSPDDDDTDSTDGTSPIMGKEKREVPEESANTSSIPRQPASARMHHSVHSSKEGKVNSTSTTTASTKRPAVPRPRNTDVILGRGRPYQSFSGNQRMLQIIAEHRDEYHSRQRDKKRDYVDNVLDVILEGGTRFLRRIEEDGKERWEEVSRTVAAEKVWHALRGKKTPKHSKESDQSSINGESERRAFSLPNGVTYSSGAQQPQTAGTAPVARPIAANDLLQQNPALALLSGSGLTNLQATALVEHNMLLAQALARSPPAPSLLLIPHQMMFQQAQDLQRLLSASIAGIGARSGFDQHAFLRTQQALATLSNFNAGFPVQQGQSTPSVSMAMALAGMMALPGQESDGAIEATQGPRINEVSVEQGGSRWQQSEPPSDGTTATTATTATTTAVNSGATTSALSSEDAETENDPP